MAIDETWAREVAAGTRQPTIRLWEWAGPAVVIGRFQSAQDEVNLDIAKQLGFDVVRRCTGGGAMFIEPGNTSYLFSVCAARFRSGRKHRRILPAL